MLEKIDLSRSLDKEEYQRIAPLLRERIGELQRRARAANMPVMIAFEGWEASGKGTLMNELMRALDPRGFHVHYVRASGDDPQETFWPPMKRFWDMTPQRGLIGVYSHSWYRLVTENQAPETGYDDISSFERQLSYDGYVIIKFFLHISKKEQKKRLRKMDRDNSSTWRVSDKEWHENAGYNETAKKLDEMIQHTDSAHAPWTLIEAHDRRYAIVKILTTVARRIEAGLEESERRKTAQPEHAVEASAASPLNNEDDTLDGLTRSTLEPSVLRNLDLSKNIGQGEYDEKLPKLQDRLRELQYELYKVRRPMVIVFEGQDAAGKGGCIRRLTQKLDPRGYQVVPIAGPNDWERAHHYLWRFWTTFPKAGHIGIYDRSWYGRVLVERVEGFAREGEWRRAYGEMNEMEDQWRRYGAIIVKFWLQIDMDEQLARFTERQQNQEKNWKITDEDWRNREKWPSYEEAAEEMMLRTSTIHAPWTIIEAQDKLFARIKVLRKAVETAENALCEKR
ncbi:MAG: polyphosphate:AMP phosphotransferase [Synergistaceae bacterium]|nr:polyphosphate:AMP phosphotransferase [Synergistaceae bacterium]